MIWHAQLPISVRSLQQLPKWLRKYPSSYGVFHKIGFAVVAGIRMPVRAWHYFWEMRK